MTLAVTTNVDSSVRYAEKSTLAVFNTPRKRGFGLFSVADCASWL